MNKLLIKDLETTLDQLDNFKGRVIYLGDYETDSQLGIPFDLSDDIIPLIKGVIKHRLKTISRDIEEQS